MNFEALFRTPLPDDHDAELEYAAAMQFSAAHLPSGADEGFAIERSAQLSGEPAQLSELMLGWD